MHDTNIPHLLARLREHGADNADQGNPLLRLDIPPCWTIILNTGEGALHHGGRRIAPGEGLIHQHGVLVGGTHQAGDLPLDAEDALLHSLQTAVQLAEREVEHRAGRAQGAAA